MGEAQCFVFRAVEEVLVAVCQREQLAGQLVQAEVQHQAADIVQQAGDEQALRVQHAGRASQTAGDEAGEDAVAPEGVHVHQRVGDAGEGFHCRDGQHQVVELAQTDHRDGAGDGIHPTAQAVVRAVHQAQQACREVGVAQDELTELLGRGVLVLDQFRHPQADVGRGDQPGDLRHEAFREPKPDGRDDVGLPGVADCAACCHHVFIHGLAAAAGHGSPKTAGSIQARGGWVLPAGAGPEPQSAWAAADLSARFRT